MNQTLQLKVSELNTLAMVYETSVQLLPADNYPEAFYNRYEIKSRNQKLVPAYCTFQEALREVSGYDVWQPIAEKTESLFGEPKRIMVFEDVNALREELEGPDGLAPFFFVFDLIFCEYDDFTLCYVSGSNN